MTTTPYQQAREQRYDDVFHDIEDGDVAFFENGGWLGRLYRKTHVELCRWERDETGKTTVLKLTGFREFEGARGVTLKSQVQRFPGRISIYRPVVDRHTRMKAADLLSRQEGKRYAWWMIVVATFYHFTLGRFLTGWYVDGTEDAPTSKWNAWKVCSSSVTWAYRKSLGKGRIYEGPCPTVPEWRCFPQRLAEDSFFGGHPLFANLVTHEVAA